MTLDETRKVKFMSIKGTFTEVNDLLEVWQLTYPLGELSLSGIKGEYSISFTAEFYRALYVLGAIVEAVRDAKADCHLEISCSYRDE